MNKFLISTIISMLFIIALGWVSADLVWASRVAFTIGLAGIVIAEWDARKRKSSQLQGKFPH
ncbi:hypothetical protein ACFPGO_03325 [Arcanobacterium canis]|uniref:Uncharacterized protein n=1 Tax=Arcanobacterium canis TaxID=999183 RepID=A0ABY8G136_9ACTO|nr:hypothetical protein [Arcanobacterium canis]WFM83011.1 hypothetical protein P7079_06330 [Arcanobacterium canis]